MSQHVNYYPFIVTHDASGDDGTLYFDLSFLFGLRAKELFVLIHKRTNQTLYNAAIKKNAKCLKYIQDKLVWTMLSYDRLSRFLMFSKRKTIELVKGLEEEGVLHVRRSGAGTKTKANLYAIDYMALQKAIWDSEDEDVSIGVVNCSPLHPHYGELNSLKEEYRGDIKSLVDESQSDRGDFSDMLGVQSDTQNAVRGDAGEQVGVTSGNPYYINNLPVGTSENDLQSGTDVPASPINSQVSDNYIQAPTVSRNLTDTSASGSQSEASIIIRHGEDNYSEDDNVNVTKEYSDDNNKADVNIIRQDANDFIEYMRAELTKEQRDSNNKADVNYPAKLDANSIPEGEDALDVLEDRIELDDPEYGLFKDALTFVREYPLYYKDLLGKEHPELSNERKIECFNAIVPLMRKYYLKSSDVYEIMELCFSAKTDTSDKRIYHFVDSNVFKYFHGVWRSNKNKESLQVANQ